METTVITVDSPVGNKSRKHWFETRVPLTLKMPYALPAQARHACFLVSESRVNMLRKYGR